MKSSESATWRLEIVKGGAPGRVYPLGAASVVLGSAPGGIDLSDQLPPGGKDLAVRHCELVPSATGFAIRDLESPSGTFVNRVAVLPGWSTSLKPGDLIAIGPLQLRIALASETDPASAPPRNGEAAKERREFVFSSASGITCKSWDDFLTFSAQNWTRLRDELASGRLDRFVESVGVRDLAVPGPEAGGLDERLDQWLGKIPAAKPAAAELDVAPLELRISADRGGTVRRAIRVSNVGYRLLKSTVRASGDARTWIKTDDLYSRPFTTIESTNVPLEVTVPESLDRPLRGVIEIESNGGKKRVEIVVEKRRRETIEAVVPEPEPFARGILDRVRELSLGARMVSLAGVLVAARLLFAASARLGEGLRGPAFAFALAGGIAGIAFAVRKNRPWDAFFSGFAGFAFGIMAACVSSSSFSAVESALGAWSSATPIATTLWGAIAAILALVSARLVPAVKPTSGKA